MTPVPVIFAPGKSRELLLLAAYNVAQRHRELSAELETERKRLSDAHAGRIRLRRELR